MAEIPHYPDYNFPVLYADNVSSVHWNAAGVKFYLSRNQPNLNATGPHIPTPFAQIVMPVMGFVAAAVFFEQQLKSMLDQKMITKEQVDELRTAARNAEPGGPI